MAMTSLWMSSSRPLDVTKRGVSSKEKAASLYSLVIRLAVKLVLGSKIEILCTLFTTTCFPKEQTLSTAFIYSSGYFQDNVSLKLDKAWSKGGSARGSFVSWVKKLGRIGAEGAGGVATAIGGICCIRCRCKWGWTVRINSIAAIRICPVL